MVIGGYRLGPLVKKTASQIANDDLLGFAAEAAYNFFFSLFPLFLFAAPFIGLFGNARRTVDWIMGQLTPVIPDQALALVRSVVEDVVFAHNAPGLISIGIVLTAWSGSNVFRTLMDTLNHAYGVRETRPWWKRALMSLAALVVVGILIIIASTIMLAGPEIASVVGAKLHLGSALVTLWTVIQYPIALALLVLIFFMIYRFLPNMRQSAKQILVGSVVATVLWIVVTILFRLYVAHFGSYNKTYGAVGAVIVVLTWMYLTMVVVLAAGSLNSQIHRGTGLVNPRKGAVYEGRIVNAAGPPHASTERVAPLSASGPEHHGDASRS
jgi:membrane protein